RDARGVGQRGGQRRQVAPHEPVVPSGRSGELHPATQAVRSDGVNRRSAAGGARPRVGFTLPTGRVSDVLDETYHRLHGTDPGFAGRPTDPWRPTPWSGSGRRGRAPA